MNLWTPLFLMTLALEAWAALLRGNAYLPAGRHEKEAAWKS